MRLRPACERLHLRARNLNQAQTKSRHYEDRSLNSHLPIDYNNTIDSIRSTPIKSSPSSEQSTALLCCRAVARPNGTATAQLSATTHTHKHNCTNPISSPSQPNEPHAHNCHSDPNKPITKLTSSIDLAAIEQANKLARTHNCIHCNGSVDCYCKQHRNELRNRCQRADYMIDVRMYNLSNEFASRVRDPNGSDLPSAAIAFAAAYLLAFWICLCV